MVAPPSSLQPPILANVTIDNLMKHMFDAQAMPPYCCNKYYSQSRSRLATHTLSIMTEFCCNIQQACLPLSFATITIIHICCNSHSHIVCHIQHIYKLIIQVCCNNYEAPAVATFNIVNLRIDNRCLLQQSCCHLLYAIYIYIHINY